MKLVDILARELKEWVSDWPAMGQAKDGTLHREPFLGGHTSFSLTRASDYVQAIVTRAQWKEAREALSKPAETPAWNGEGHPPLGTICEFTQSNSPFARCEVVFSSPWVTVVRGKGFDDDAVDIAVSCMDKDARFRPIRTPEQIAAEEREKFIDELIKVTCIRRGEAGLIYDAGYRKVKGGEE